MTSRLLLILSPTLLVSTLALCSPKAAAAIYPKNPAEVNMFEIHFQPDFAHEGNLEVAEDELAIKLTGRQLRVRNATGQTMEVYSVTGTKVAAYKIDAADKTIRLDFPRGCYIVRIGDFARKISLI